MFLLGTPTYPIVGYIIVHPNHMLYVCIYIYNIYTQRYIPIIHLHSNIFLALYPWLKLQKIFSPCTRMNETHIIPTIPTLLLVDIIATSLMFK